jgi:hypothetical protein
MPGTTRWVGGVKVRPYVRTGGRNRPVVDLALEALVSTAARVLVGDLAQDGVVVVRGTSGLEGPDTTLMQRVLDGLRRL